jgi:hypothetical protein
MPSSERKIRANRANARISTGPKTRSGRARAARNALRHGLSLPVCSDPAFAEEVETLASEIAGTDANAEVREVARRVAEAQIDLRRVRSARHQLLTRVLNDPYYDAQEDARERVPSLSSLLHPGRRRVSQSALTTFSPPTTRDPEKFAVILSQETKRLLAMDRYERRALFRRRIAVQAFDEAKHKIVDIVRINQ